MNPIKENVREEEAKKLLNEINESGDLNIVDEMLKNNQIEFEIKDKKYRVRLLNLKEKIDLDILRRKKFGQLIQDKDILLEKDLIKVYKERGINIEEIDDKMNKIKTEVNTKQILLGESIAKNDGETILKTYADQIKNLNDELNILFLQRLTLLEFSLENQLLNYIAQIITFLSTDVMNEEGYYRRMWKTVEEFIDSSENDLINKAGSASMILQYSI
jgi:hypothetical protein